MGGDGEHSTSLKCLLSSGGSSWLEDMDPHRYKHKRNPSKHSILANIPDLINKESQAKPFRFPRASSKTRDVPILEKEGEYEGKENFGERKSSRPEKRVTWSKDLLQVRSISPRQRQIQHRLASPRSSRINTITSSSPSTSTSSSYPSFASSFPSNFSSPSSSSSSSSTHLGLSHGLGPTTGTDCGHFLCHRVGRGEMSHGGESGVREPATALARRWQSEYVHQPGTALLWHQSPTLWHQSPLIWHHSKFHRRFTLLSTAENCGMAQCSHQQDRTQSRLQTEQCGLTPSMTWGLTLGHCLLLL